MLKCIDLENWLFPKKTYPIWKWLCLFANQYKHKSNSKVPNASHYKWWYQSLQSPFYIILIIKIFLKLIHIDFIELRVIISHSVNVLDSKPIIWRPDNMFNGFQLIYILRPLWQISFTLQSLYFQCINVCRMDFLVSIFRNAYKYIIIFQLGNRVIWEIFVHEIDISDSHSNNIQPQMVNANQSHFQTGVWSQNRYCFYGKSQFENKWSYKRLVVKKTQTLLL